MSYERSPSIHDGRYRNAVEILVTTRKRVGISQTQLALSVGLSQPDISKIERLDRRMDICECWDIIMVLVKDDLAKAKTLWMEVGESIDQPQ